MKDYKIYRFDVYHQITRSKNESKCNKQRHINAQSFTQFQIDLINKFNRESFEELAKYTSFGKLFGDKLGLIYTEYKKKWLFSQYDIGLDMLNEDLGLKMEHQWMYLYWHVPLNQPKLIKFFDDYKPPFNIKIVSKI